MGGLAIKKVIGKEGRRISLIEKLELQKEITHIFYSLSTPSNNLSRMTGFHFSFIPEIQSKETFGDMDILVTTYFPLKKDNCFNIHKEVSIFGYYSNISTKQFLEIAMKNHFKEKYQGVVKNSDTWSFAIDDMQLDFIFQDNTLNMPKFYFSNNDMGNLIGRIARSIGLKFGHSGLFLPVRDYDNSHIIDELLLSNQWENILPFLGFSQKTINENLIYFKKGFPTFEDMYKFVISSELFDGSKYDLDKLNQQNRIRNKKRKTYMDFIEYLNNHSEYKSKKPDYILEDYWKLKCIQYFSKEEEYINILLEKEKRKNVSLKFNADIIKEITGLENKELGDFIKKFKANYSIDTLDSMKSNDIRQLIEILNGQKYNKEEK